MMQTYTKLDIQEIPLSSPYFHREVEHFLSDNGLRMESLDEYYVIRDEAGAIVSGAGIAGDVLKCVAVSAEARSEGLLVPLVSHIISERQGRNLKVFTKPEYQAVFESLGFKLLARSPQAILLENGRGLEQYCAYLRSRAVEGRSGVVVMHANPFTLGHRYLLETAAAQVDTLFVIPVAENVSSFTAAERLQMIREGAPDGVCVLEGSSYQISALTFPTYFLKDLSDAAETQMELDIDLFARHIAPALNVSVRFVGSEPADALTARYNVLMSSCLNTVEIPRLVQGGTPVSASRVRAFLQEGRYADAAALVPDSSRPYLLAQLSCDALRQELDCPLKPGLVGPDGRGAHNDMDFALMQRSISALHSHFARMGAAADVAALRQAGLDAEKAMLEATGGVNTHRGAIYSLGLMLYAREKGEAVAQVARALSAIGAEEAVSHGQEAVARYGVKGARKMAEEGYTALYQDWLPFYETLRTQDDKYTLQKTLLRILSTLDDTCVIHRVGYARAQEVKREAAQLLSHFSEEELQALCERYAAEGISPGGAADMLALTIFTQTIITH